MAKNYIRENQVLIAIALFLIIYGIIQIIKPSCFYNTDGSIREFGIGYRNKTILPIWLMSIVLGILCYLVVIYYVNYYNKIVF
jgi:uncharacterized membrane protein YozB (DUF420 family)